MGRVQTVAEIQLWRLPGADGCVGRWKSRCCETCGLTGVQLEERAANVRAQPTCISPCKTGAQGCGSSPATPRVRSLLTVQPSEAAASQGSDSMSVTLSTTTVTCREPSMTGLSWERVGSPVKSRPRADRGKCGPLPVLPAPHLQPLHLLRLRPGGVGRIHGCTGKKASC